MTKLSEKIKDGITITVAFATLVASLALVEPPVDCNDTDYQSKTYNNIKNDNISMNHFSLLYKIQNRIPTQ